MTVHHLLSALPGLDELRARCRALALLDSIVSVPYEPDHSYVAEWRPGVDLACMGNGSGDQYAIVFDPAGVFLYGFDHESDATPWREEDRAHWPGLLDGLPGPLAHYAQAPEFQFEGFFDATVCAWRETRGTGWRCGPVEFADGETDGADWLFDLLTAADGTEAFVGYAEEHHERSVDREAVAAVLADTPLDRRMVSALSPTANFDTVAALARTLGYHTVREDS
ncbi:hypothetical protein ACFVTF_07350 [Kitasatospora sp. NPDC057940]|uniref:hypothetical protein n=1 Tax=Kitasatospora sp. NPDC057940 TaxID=3346285 RepID=UPI0036DAFC14